MQGDEGPLLLSLSPSFSSYSSEKLAEIAARVIEEFRKESEFDPDTFDWKADDSSTQHRDSPSNDKPEEFNREAQTSNDGENIAGEVGDDEFEFAVVPREPYATTISAEDIFYNGKIRPIYPVFNMNLLLNSSPVDGNNNVDDDDNDLKKFKPTKVRRPSLGKLMREEREANSCSSSEADEFDGVLPGTYCVWSPKESLDRCKKSNSMGSSKRWKLRDLLYRSNSDGKDVFVFLTPNKKLEKVAGVAKEKGIGIDDERTAGKVKASRVVATTTAAHVTPTAADEGQYVKNGATKEADKKTSIPYRQDLVGLFANVNGKSRNLQSF